MRGIKCDRCGRYTLELYHVLVPKQVIGDTDACNVKNIDFGITESICHRCFEILKKKLI